MKDIFFNLNCRYLKELSKQHKAEKTMMLASVTRYKEALDRRFNKANRLLAYLDVPVSFTQRGEPSVFSPLDIVIECKAKFHRYSSNDFTMYQDSSILKRTFFLFIIKTFLCLDSKYFLVVSNFLKSTSQICSYR